MTVKHLQKGTTAHACCTEKYFESDAFGEKVIPYVNVFDKTSRNARPIARLSCGEEVTIVASKHLKNISYYKIRADVDGSDNVVEGWVKFTMLDEAVGGSYGEVS